MGNLTPCAYRTMGYDGRDKVYIGEPNRDKRVCRFCGKSQPTVKFSKKAHALSESLGNKFIINNEECDTCNDFFSSIEQDFYNRHAFHLTCCNVKGKNGTRKIKTNEISIFNHNGILTFDQLNLSSLRESNGVTKLDFSSLLKGYPHKPQNIYKCLVKYALSILEQPYLGEFGRTIEWITNNALSINTLPKVLFYSTEFHDHPRIAYFIRDCQHEHFPFAFAAVEFTNIGYSFIIPLAHNEPITGYMELNLKNAFNQVFENRDFVEVDLSGVRTTYTRQHIEIDNIIKNQTCFDISKEQFYGNCGTTVLS